MTWAEHHDPTGKLYYFNSVTNQSTWEKPIELMTALERAIGYSDWKEYTQKDTGRKYYYNKVTKKSTWKLPEEFNDIVESMQFEEKRNKEKASGPVYVNFETKEEAEEAWLEMLRTVGVEPNWTWEQCIRKASGNPIYRALKTTAERKEAFERYCRETKEERLELKQRRLEDDERALEKLFSKTRELTGSTRFRTAEKMFDDNPVWTTTLPQNRRNYFFTYIDRLKEKEKKTAYEIQKSNIEKLKKLLNTLNIDHTISFKDAQTAFKAHTLFSSDPQLSKMNLMDILITFQNHVLFLDSKFRQERNAKIQSIKRSERKIRDGFRDLLKENVKAGIITPKSKWKDLYQKSKDDPRLIQMLGNNGSTPLEMFWDCQYKLDERYRLDKEKIDSVLDRARYYIQPETKFENFFSEFKRDFEKVDKVSIKLYFDSEQASAIRYEAKKQRKKIDAFRSVLKHFEPPIQLGESFENVVKLIESRAGGVPEYDRLTTHERQLAFEKFMSRLRKKIERKDKKRAGDDRSSESDRSGSDIGGNRHKKKKERTGSLQRDKGEHVTESSADASKIKETPKINMAIDESEEEGEVRG